MNDLKILKETIAANGIDNSQDEIVKVARIYFEKQDYSSAYFWIRKMNGHTVASKGLLEAVEKKLFVC